ncbi:MAG TPA: NUDIX hydrolase [Candidatus Saccharimonadales bacterium]|nr:NUDIX hydrolase [Candidatus Saccharimonadales bacterium]
MNDKRYSVMILPRRQDDSLLLQSWTNEDGTVTDGFGSFYQANEDPKQTAAKELGKFEIKAQLSEVARLQYFMDKPTGLVDLKITIYFADIEEEPLLQEQMHWFAPDDVPYAQIHPATGKWLPLLLAGQIPLKATIKVHQPGHHTKGKVTEFTVEK